ncbi:hypothetical protein [Actinomadura nitritigenes]|uniref:hypothetical protein n=1 Tax=Actinomadura nitritigenes TaxID=134602 RepID=UPI003D91387F
MAPDPDPDQEPLPAFAPAAMPDVRPYLPPTWANYVDGDFYGLQNLATQLYDLALKGNPLVERLRAEVNGLLGRQNHARWSGRSASSFAASYGQDSSMLSALGKIVAAAAGIVDHLAEKLATIEHAIEQEVSYGLEQGYFIRGADWAKSSTPEPNLNIPGSTSAMDEFVRKRRLLLEQADKDREVAAAELLRISGLLMEMLNYYRKRSRIGTLDPGGLLNIGQTNWYTPRIQKLEDQLKLERQHIEGADVDGKIIGKDMQKIGGGAETIGGLMGLIGPLKPAGETVSTVGGVVSQLGEVTEHFG